MTAAANVFEVHDWLTIKDAVAVADRGGVASLRSSSQQQHTEPLVGASRHGMRASSAEAGYAHSIGARAAMMLTTVTRDATLASGRAMTRMSWQV
jgi:hypothetical protein